MDFNLSTEQQQLKDSARRFVREQLDFESRERNLQDGCDRWADIAELGWLMLPVPSSAGGLDGAVEDMGILAEELGRGSALEPFVDGAILPARIMAMALGDDGGFESHLASLASGEKRYAAALYETDRRYLLSELSTTLTVAPDGGWCLSGSKELVFAGGDADWLLVAANMDDQPEPALVLIDANTEGVERRCYRSITGDALADFSFNKVQLPADTLVVPAKQAEQILDQAIDEATVLLCADAIGCMERAIEMTVEYLHTREQFGRPLAKFQALQHGVANLFVDTNHAKSIVYRAMASLDDSDSNVRRKAVSACKFKVMDTARHVTGQAIHFHGGIGMTCEYPVGEFLRRTLVAEQRFGNGQFHLERYSEC